MQSHASEHETLTGSIGRPPESPAPPSEPRRPEEEDELF